MAAPGSGKVTGEGDACCPPAGAGGARPVPTGAPGPGAAAACLFVCPRLVGEARPGPSYCWALLLLSPGGAGGSGDPFCGWGCLPRPWRPVGGGCPCRAGGGRAPCAGSLVGEGRCLVTDSERLAPSRGAGDIGCLAPTEAASVLPGPASLSRCSPSVSPVLGAASCCSDLPLAEAAPLHSLGGVCVSEANARLLVISWLFKILALL